MKRLFKFKYPKIVLLLLSIVAAYLLFKNPSISSAISSVGSIKYLGPFIAGVLFAFGFTAPIAVGFFITYAPQDIYTATIIGALGVMVANLLLFSFIRFSFMDEFKRLERTRTMKKIEKYADKEIRKTLGEKMKIYLIYIFAGITLASPLPDEIGVIMLSGLAHIKQHALAIFTFIFSAIGIFILLSI